MKKIWGLVLLFTISLYLVACNNNIREQNKDESNLATACFDSLGGMLNTPDGDTLKFFAENAAYPGMRVKRSEIDPCLKEFERVMGLHGIVVNPPGQVDCANIPNTKITTRIAFRGKELLEFLNDASRLHGGDENVDVHLALGIYTDGFVQNRDPLRRGRIGIFLVTRNSHSPLSSNLPYSGDDEDAFDFGGIHP